MTEEGKERKNHFLSQTGRGKISPAVSRFPPLTQSLKRKSREGNFFENNDEIRYSSSNRKKLSLSISALTFFRRKDENELLGLILFRVYAFPTDQFFIVVVATQKGSFVSNDLLTAFTMDQWSSKISHRNPAPDWRSKKKEITKYLTYLISLTGSRRLLPRLPQVADDVVERRFRDHDVVGVIGAFRSRRRCVLHSLRIRMTNKPRVLRDYHFRRKRVFRDISTLLFIVYVDPDPRWDSRQVPSS